MTVSTTRRTVDPYVIDEACSLLELLCRTHVPPSMVQTEDPPLLPSFLINKELSDKYK